MAVCSVCKTEETQLHENGVPICIGCVNAQEKKQDEIKRKAAASAGGNGDQLGRVQRYPSV